MIVVSVCSEHMLVTHDEIRGARKRLGLSQLQLANLLAVHPMTVYKWESKRARPESTQEHLLLGVCRASQQGTSARARRELGQQIAEGLAEGGILRGLSTLFRHLDALNSPKIGRPLKRRRRARRAVR